MHPIHWNHSHDVAKNYYNLSYCANFGSENGKFHLRIIDHTDTPKIIGLCVKHGAKNGTDGCWVINGNYEVRYILTLNLQITKQLGILKPTLDGCRSLPI